MGASESGVNDGLYCWRYLAVRKLTPKAETGRRGGMTVKTIDVSLRLLPALTEYCQLNHHPEPLLMNCQ
ncbi:hypothetical protein KCP75_15500 [Salmonella enterica subsp. enterica]|nr:hypothetical protein KCP75_15500 [Salmonella enterica subsp. enterica]